MNAAATPCSPYTVAARTVVSTVSMPTFVSIRSRWEI
jgi:hypothetical protein